MSREEARACRKDLEREGKEGRGGRGGEKRWSLLGEKEKGRDWIVLCLSPPAKSVSRPR